MKPTLLIAACLALAALGTARAGELSLEDAVERVQKDSGGRILAAEEVHIGKKKIYRIKLLTHDGSVRVVQLGAETAEAPEREAKPVSGPQAG